MLTVVDYFCFKLHKFRFCVTDRPLSGELLPKDFVLETLE